MGSWTGVPTPDAHEATLHSKPWSEWAGEGERRSGFFLKRAKQSSSRARPLWQLYVKWPEVEARSEDSCSSQSKESQPKVAETEVRKGKAQGSEAGSNGEQSGS